MSRQSLLAPVLRTFIEETGEALQVNERLSEDARGGKTDRRFGRLVEKAEEIASMLNALIEGVNRWCTDSGHGRWGLARFAELRIVIPRTPHPQTMMTGRGMWLKAGWIPDRES